MLKLLVELVAVASLLAGLALVSIPVALIAAGVLGIAAVEVRP